MTRGVSPSKRAYLYPEPGKRRCGACGTVKPFSEFFRKAANGGVESRCKVCKMVSRADIRKRLHGKPDATIAARFWPKVNKDGPNGCWIWTGNKIKRGYGNVFFQGSDWYSHRVSWLLAGRELVDGLVLDHICKTLLCVNPDHLRLVTQAENCGPLAKPTPHWKNAQKTHCVHGHPFDLGNLAVIQTKGGGTTRVCLICNPFKWRFAVVKRDPPPNARNTKRNPAVWLGPAVARKPVNATNSSQPNAAHEE